VQNNTKTKLLSLYFKRFLRAAKFTGENVKQIGFTDIKTHMNFLYLQDCTFWCKS